MTVFKVWVGLFLCLMCTVSSYAAPKQEKTGRLCQDVVERFYHWYLTKAWKQKHMLPAPYALKHRAYLFSSSIITQVTEDCQAQVMAGSDLVSLDADPFVGPDGPAQSYIVERVTTKDDTCWAEVYGVWGGEKREEPDVTPKLVSKAHGQWVFENFYFPTSSNPRGVNLLDALKRTGNKSLR